MATKKKSVKGGSAIAKANKKKPALSRGQRGATIGRTKVFSLFDQCPNPFNCATCKPEDRECKTLSDNDLILIVQTKNKEVFQEIIRRYEKKLFLYVYHFVGNKEESEDLVQNVFAKTYKNLDRFDLDRKFSSWIYRIAHNEAVNYLKKKSKKQFISWEDIVSTKDQLETSADEEKPEDLFSHKEITKEVHDAIDKLPKRYKQVLELRYFAEYSYEGIGKILGKPVNTVGTLINRAKRKLLEIIQTEGDGR